MKKLLFILSLLFVTSVRLFAQDNEGENEGGEKIRDKMNEFIQKRLDLSKDEAEKFTPVFLRYFREWRQTLKDSRGLPMLDRQQKIVDLRLRYRAQFREIVGEQRGNQIFQHQEIFIQRLRDERNERLRINPNRQMKRGRINRLF